MSEIAYSTELLIRQPAQVIWRRLISFDEYPSWNPYQKIEGEAKAGAKVRFSVSWGNVSRKSVPARITAFDAPRRLEFTIGWPGFRERRWIELEPVEQGVRVRHGVRFTGWLAQIAFKYKLRIERLEPYYDAWGAALAGRARSAAPPQDGKPMNRRQRRAARRKAGS